MKSLLYKQNSSLDICLPIMLRKEIIIFFDKMIREVQDGLIQCVYNIINKRTKHLTETSTNTTHFVK